MAKKKISVQSNIRRGSDNHIVKGVLGVILSIIGLLLAFKTGTENTVFFIVYLILIIVGIVLVAKALSD